MSSQPAALLCSASVVVTGLVCFTTYSARATAQARMSTVSMQSASSTPVTQQLDRLTQPKAHQSVRRTGKAVTKLLNVDMRELGVCNEIPAGRRAVFIETPMTSFSWSPEATMTAGSGTGMSGTHTALVAISRRFAAEGWLTVLNGNLTGVPSVPGMCYVSPKSSKAVATWLASVVFDLTVLSNIFQS